ncbi:hypothetical protein L209DRAFT_342246 [Thermothelomyces heterothallicus CBS 203.75]
MYEIGRGRNYVGRLWPCDSLAGPFCIYPVFGITLGKSFKSTQVRGRSSQVWHRFVKSSPRLDLTCKQRWNTLFALTPGYTLLPMRATSNPSLAGPKDLCPLLRGPMFMLFSSGLSELPGSFGNRWLLPGNSSAKAQSIKGVLDNLHAKHPGEDDC